MSSESSSIKSQNPTFFLSCFLTTYQDRPMYLIRAVTVHSNRPKEVWFGPSAYTARILWSGGEFFLLRALGDHLWGHSGALWAPRHAACAERRRRQLPKPLPVSGVVCWRSGSLRQGVRGGAYGSSQHHMRSPHQLCMSHGQQTFVLIVHDSELTYLSHFFTV